jgi:hypothetical protein
MPHAVPRQACSSTAYDTRPSREPPIPITKECARGDYRPEWVCSQGTAGGLHGTRPLTVCGRVDVPDQEQLPYRRIYQARCGRIEAADHGSRNRLVAPCRVEREESEFEQNARREDADVSEKRAEDAGRGGKGQGEEA